MDDLFALIKAEKKNSNGKEVKKTHNKKESVDEIKEALISLFEFKKAIFEDNEQPFKKFFDSLILNLTIKSGDKKGILRVIETASAFHRILYGFLCKANAFFVDRKVPSQNISRFQLRGMIHHLKKAKEHGHNMRNIKLSETIFNGPLEHWRTDLLRLFASLYLQHPADYSKFMDFVGKEHPTEDEEEKGDDDKHEEDEENSEEQPATDDDWYYTTFDVLSMNVRRIYAVWLDAINIASGDSDDYTEYKNILINMTREINPMNFKLTFTRNHDEYSENKIRIVKSKKQDSEEDDDTDSPKRAPARPFSSTRGGSASRGRGVSTRGRGAKVLTED